MSNLNPVDLKTYRYERLLEMEKYYARTIEEHAAGYPGSEYQLLGKIPQNFNGKRVIGLFKSELTGGKNLYIEFLRNNYEPLDEDRKLYFLPYSPYYINELPSHNERYFFPVEELKIIWQLGLVNNAAPVASIPTPSPAPSPVLPNQFKSPSPSPPQDPLELLKITPFSELGPVKKTVDPKPQVNEIPQNAQAYDMVDMPMHSLSARDLMAIMFRKPISGKSWINQLIRENT
jgi:hypothetical protein